jgi:uncharacterized delta-60 repeat protein
MHLLEPIEGWTSFMMEPLEARVMLAAADPGDLPSLEDLLFVRDAGAGKVVVADSAYDEQSVVLLRLAPDGTPDTTFGPLGIVRIRGLSVITDLAVQPDGKTLVLADLVDGRVGVVRVTTDGKLDEAFGDGGLALAPDGPVDYWHIASGRMALGDDGRIVVGEVVADVNDVGGADGLYVTRFDADGHTDPTFGDGGITLLHAPLPLAELDAVNVRADGGIDVSVPPLGVPGGVFARLGADGSPDPSFGDGGILLRDLGGSFYDWHALPDGRTLAYEHPPIAHETPRLHAYDRDGNPDPTFGVDGAAEFVGASPYIPVTAPAVRSGDRTILALFASNPIFGHLELIAIDDAGSIDTDWGFWGRRNLADDAGARGDSINLAIADNGDLLTVRIAYDAAGPYDEFPLQLVVNRFRPDGTPEYNFGLGGEVILDLAKPGEFYPEEPAPAPTPGGDDGESQDAGQVPAAEPQDNPSQAAPPPRGSPFSSQPIDEGAAAVLLLGTPTQRSLFDIRPDEVFDA